MGALTIFKTNGGNGIPEGRRALVDLLETIDSRSADLERLKEGRRRLQDQLQLVDGARNELESILAQESRTLIDRIKGSVDWALSSVGGHRAQKITESLAACKLQTSIGGRAASELDSEIKRSRPSLKRCAPRSRPPSTL